MTATAGFVCLAPPGSRSGVSRALLRGWGGGLDERQGHTEASLALCDPAGVATVAAICEVMGPDGHMLSGSGVERFALAWALPMISIGELAAHL